MKETPYYTDMKVKDTIDEILKESVALRAKIGTGQLDKIAGSKDIAIQKKWCADWERANLAKCEYLDQEFINFLIESGG